MLIDCHVHFDDPRFDSDRDDVYQRARDAGVSTMIMPATSRLSWHKTKTIAEQYENIFPAYGLHPYLIDQHQHDHLLQLKLWIESEKPIAVGECGLDFFLSELDQKKQRDFFEAQLSIAKDYDLPVIIHARGAVEEVIQMVKKSAHNKGMIHSYNGSLQQARQLIDLGYYLSFGGAITYDRAKKLRRLIRELPLDALLLETDAPDQPGSALSDQRNEPGFILQVLQTFVELRVEDKEIVQKKLFENTVNLFQGILIGSIK